MEHLTTHRVAQDGWMDGRGVELFMIDRLEKPLMIPRGEIQDRQTDTHIYIYINIYERE